MIDIQNLSFAYPKGPPVLDHINLTLNQGEIIGILGPNGVGKSTLLKLMLFPALITHGSILYQGQNIQELPLTKRSHLLGWIAPHLSTLFNYQVYDIVRMGLFPRSGFLGSCSTAQKQELFKIAEQTNISHLLTKSYNQISSGEQQRVQLAKALLQAPQLLLMDEPISHLDIHYQKEFQQIIKDQNKKSGITIILVSHNINLVSCLCDRIVLLNQGKIIDQGPPRTVITAPNILTLFKTPVLVHYPDHSPDTPIIIQYEAPEA